MLQSISRPDPQGVDWLVEAQEAYTWAESNFSPAQLPVDKWWHTREGCRLYAAAALYRATGQANYQEQFISDLAVINKEDFTNRNMSKYGVWLYANMEKSNRTFNQAALQECQDLVKSTGDFIMFFTEARACRWAGNFWMPLAIGQATTPLIEDGIIAYGILKDKDPAHARKYLARMFTTADYFLGTNPLNQSWVTGVGPRHPTQVMHVDWWYSGIDAVMPGIVPYGPYIHWEDVVWVGPWSHINNFYSMYPRGAINWPPHERWFNSRYAIITGEFTVHQNTVSSAMVYGALCAGAAGSHAQPAAPGFSAGDSRESSAGISVVAVIDGILDIRLYHSPAARAVPNRLQIHDVRGRLVGEHSAPSCRDRIALPIKNLSKGVYMVRIADTETAGNSVRFIIR